VAQHKKFSLFKWELVEGAAYCSSLTDTWES